MEIAIEQSWKNVLSDEFEKPYFRDLIAFVKTEYATHKCFPPGNQIFSAFNKCPFQNVKVVILGQDPYHGPNQAHGLCFSVNDGIPFPPSLRNIFEELRRDLSLPLPVSGNLERWASQGVLLLNATLTVRQGDAGSHQKKGWEQCTDAVIDILSKEKENVVFLLWGGYARKKGARIDSTKHLVLETGHPSPLSANKGHWFNNSHFSQTNEFLRKVSKDEIVW